MDRVGRVVSHDAFSPDVAFVGLTRAGTPVLVNRLAAEAQFSVAISTVYPHAFAAWGGGAKMVLPGICHVSTCYYNHTRIRGGGQWAGRPDRSPARRDIEEAAALFGLDVAVCALVNPAKQLCGLLVGDPTRAHRNAVRLARRLYHTDIPAKRPDLVIANAYPFDGDPTQTAKTEIPAKRCGVPILMIADFADPCSWHGTYDGHREAYLRRLAPAPQQAPDLLWKAEVFLYCPQVGRGYTPKNRSWYCENDWDRLMTAMAQRFPRADVAVLPAAPLQIPASPHP
jgi:nickel-dependent lactate racemase